MVRSCGPKSRGAARSAFPRGAWERGKRVAGSENRPTFLHSAKEDNMPEQKLSITRMTWASIRHGWRVAFSVALGVATATAVIAGALLVGDSMRGSLRGLTVERLGRTESAVMPGRFFDADHIADEPVPLILFASGVVESDPHLKLADPAQWFEDADTNHDSLLDNSELERAMESDHDDSADSLLERFDQDGDGRLSLREFLRMASVRRAGSIQIVGCDPSFWQLDVSGVRPSKLPDDDGVVMNQSAAKELGVKVGDLVTIRLPVQQAVPADSPLGRRDIQTEGLPRMEVLDILPDRGLGRFALSPSQAAPQNVFMARGTIGDVLQREGQANMLLFDRQITDDDLQIGLEDLGLSLNRIQRSFTPPGGQQQIIYDYYSLTSDQLLLPELVVDRVTEELPAEKVTPINTYLANAIERLDESGQVVASVPYSTVSAIDSTGPLPLDYGRRDGEATKNAVPLVINQWTADRLQAEVGTTLRVAYYEPEVENGKEIERYFDAVVTGIAAITEPATPYTRREEAIFDRPPTIYNDPDLTPTVPGVTDQDSINDWDLPFQLKRKINKPDDLYWNQYRLTPKAFMPLADGRRLFGSRFGQTTSLRIDITAAKDIDSLRSRISKALSPKLADLGWSVRPIRSQQLTASRGTTPFDVLFLALSFFVILAAVMLIAMLFRLGLVERLKQFGTLLAVGWPPRRVATLARNEGLLVAVIGAILGLAGGFGYAYAVLWALRSWWVGAVTVPFLTFHWTTASLVIGAASGWLVAALTLTVTARSLMKVDAQSLLSGRDIDSQAGGGPARGRGRLLPISAVATLVLALIVAGAGAAAGGQAAAGGFVGGGMLLLIAGLLAIYVRLRRGRRIDNASTAGPQNGATARYSIRSMAAKNASRHPLRSTLTIGLMATASFLIIAISAFRLEPTEKGTGGFDLIGQSAQPLYQDLSRPEVQAEVLGPDADVLEGAQLISMRLRPGQDASCNNLYQATRPTVLGIPDSMADLFDGGDSPLPGFDWAATAPHGEDESPWRLLARSAAGSESDPIPVILDQNTAMYSLQMYGGVGEKKVVEYEPGKPLHFEVVGLLANSLLQGKLLIGNDNFEQAFENISGSQFYLIGCQDDRRDSIAIALENRLGDIGMDISETGDVLSGLLAVQNTYLRTFQSLGALGLLLGTIGLAVAQLRSVLERRQELAVLRAIGFTRKRLALLVMSETTSLLLAGIGCGAICAVLAVLPHALVADLRPPVVEPVAIVLGIILFGMLAGLAAVGRVVRMPLMESLRSE